MKRLLLLAFAAFGVVAMSGCKKEKIDYHDLILGNWTSTAESAEVTIAGAQQLPEGTIDCSFDNKEVEISDMRMNYLGQKEQYTLYEEDGALWLKVETATTNVFWLTPIRVSKLTKDCLVLEDNEDIIDAGFHYVFKRPGDPSTN